MTCDEAEEAGFRACKRCHPKEASLLGKQTKKIAEICKYIEKAETVPSFEVLASRAEMSIYHFHRLFKSITGLTPEGYAAAHQAKQVRNQLVKANSITEAIFEAGFNSNSRFYEKSDAILGMTPKDFRSGGRNTAIYFAIGECSLKTVQGQELSIKNGSGVTVNNANVVTADIITDNGVIHVIDTVVLPE